MRGPGDFLASTEGGVRQSGGMSFRFASLLKDTALIAAAAEESAAIAALSPDEASRYRAENPLLFAALDERFAESRNLLS